MAKNFTTTDFQSVLMQGKPSGGKETVVFPITMNRNVIGAFKVIEDLNDVKAEKEFIYNAGDIDISASELTYLTGIPYI